MNNLPIGSLSGVSVPDIRLRLMTCAPPCRYPQPVVSQSSYRGIPEGFELVVRITGIRLLQQ